MIRAASLRAKRPWYAGAVRAPLIGVSTSITVDKSPERAYVNTAYLRAIQAAGGIPVLLPPQLDAEALATLWDRLEGLVLTGGGDIDPARFGETRHAATDEVSPARDALELDLVHRALEDDVPLFAICRGVQVVNVALGGSLYQDIADQYGDAAGSKRTPLRHSQTEPRDRPTHAVKVMGEGTRLATIVGALELAVNSMHHQAIKTLGRGLREVAWAPDGIIEGVELADGDRFVVGVQWHPEELVARDAAARSLFAALVGEARRRATR
jgi:putative glutamine amidotransferase